MLEFKFEGFPDMSMYYLLLEKNYILTNVKEKIDTKFKEIKKDRIVVLAPKDPLQKTDRRLENLKKTLGTKKVNYFADHFFEKTLKKEEKTPLLYINDFVDPLIRYQNQNIDGIEAIINWITVSSKSSIAMISGQGGLGKTTLCKKIHDKLIEEENNYHVIFISSSQFIKQFMKIDFNNEQEYDIYNLYQIGSPESISILDRKSFEINYELGNLLIIFDGIDELISTIPSFTLESFLKNVSKIEAGIGRGKIIVNCRDTYIEDYLENLDSESSYEMDIFQLLPFSKDEAEEYFEMHFQQPRKIKNGLKLLDDFIIQGKEENKLSLIHI